MVRLTQEIMTRANDQEGRNKAHARPRLDRAAYRRDLRWELCGTSTLMQKTWGFRPDIDVEVEDVVLVRVNFNLKGFAHEGGE